MSLEEATFVAHALAYLQLMRFPAVFTAVADILLGYVLTHRSLSPLAPFVQLMLASCCLYLSGMVWNDVFDVSQDTVERPGRPIPSGRVSRRSAVMLATVLMLAGVAFAVSVLPQRAVQGDQWNAAIDWNRWAPQSSIFYAGALVVTILLYDGWAKRTPLGPLAMGACRFLNVMLGASHLDLPFWMQTIARPQIVCAAGLGVYIAGVTWFARTEAIASKRRHLAGAQLVVNAGLGILAWLMLTWPAEGSPQMPLAMLVIVGFSANRWMLKAIAAPEPRAVQMAVKTMLMSLAILDATLIFWHTRDASLSMGAALLVLPPLLLGRLIPMT